MIAFLSICFGACSQEECAPGINELPMYGRAKKCKEQIENDNQFLSGCRKPFPDNDSAVRHHVTRGWEFLNSGDLGTAMKRFNQAPGC